MRDLLYAAGLAVALAGVINLIRPLRVLGIASRVAGGYLLLAGAISILGGSLYTPNLDAARRESARVVERLAAGRPERVAALARWREARLALPQHSDQPAYLLKWQFDGSDNTGQNQAVAVEYLKERSPAEVIGAAERADIGRVLDNPGAFAGRIVQVTGMVDTVARYDEKNILTQSYAVDGPMAEVRLLAAGGITVDFLLLGAGQEAAPGRVVTVYGYPVGSSEIEGEKHLAMAGNAINRTELTADTPLNLWNRTNPDGLRNENDKIAAEYLRVLSPAAVVARADEVAYGVVIADPGPHIGRILRYSGEVVAVLREEAGSDLSRLLLHDGEIVELSLRLAAGGEVLFRYLGDPVAVREGQTVTAYGYLLGLAEGFDDDGNVIPALMLQGTALAD